jgi:hypothetical protein
VATPRKRITIKAVSGSDLENQETLQKPLPQETPLFATHDDTTGRTRAFPFPVLSEVTISPTRDTLLIKRMDG